MESEGSPCWNGGGSSPVICPGVAGPVVPRWDAPRAAEPRPEATFRPPTVRRRLWNSRDTCVDDLRVNPVLGARRIPATTHSRIRSPRTPRSRSGRGTSAGRRAWPCRWPGSPAVAACTRSVRERNAIWVGGAPVINRSVADRSSEVSNRPVYSLWVKGSPEPSIRGRRSRLPEERRIQGPLARGSQQPSDGEGCSGVEFQEEDSDASLDRLAQQQNMLDRLCPLAPTGC